MFLRHVIIAVAILSAPAACGLQPIQNTPTPMPRAGDERVIGGAPMVFVPAGEFLMGSTDEQFQAAMEELKSKCNPCPPFQNAAKPPHAVYLDAFWMDKFQVTNALYQKCVDAGNCQPPSSSRSHAHASYFGDPEYDNYPVIYVAWDDAKTFCEWAGKRLPTEAEFEKAARGTDNRIYPWGNEFQQNRVNSDHTKNDTTAVGSYPNGASPYGVLDMAGNVWVWMADWFDESYYANSPRENPLGAATGEDRVLRGGAWGSLMIQTRGSFRSANSPDARTDYIGIRCAKSAM